MRGIYISQFQTEHGREIIGSPANTNTTTEHVLTFIIIIIIIIYFFLRHVSAIHSTNIR
jgi:hypothetical protein